MTWQRDDNLMSPGNLAIVAECLMFCEDTQTLGQIREIYPADVLGAAAKQLDRVSFGRIRRWTIELNQKTA